jgi:hypothetical protein
LGHCLHVRFEKKKKVAKMSCTSVVKQGSCKGTTVIRRGGMKLTEKPQIIADYNMDMGGIDTSDTMMCA